MIIFSAPPLSSLHNLRYNILAFLSEVGVLNLLRDSLGDCLLFRRIVEDRGTVLRSTVRTLLVRRRRIMCAIEEFHEFSIRDLTRIELDSGTFSMSRRTRANETVLRVLAISTSVAYFGLDPFVLVVFDENVLGSPEASASKRRYFCRGLLGKCGIKGRFNRWLGWWHENRRDRVRMKESPPQ